MEDRQLYRDKKLLDMYFRGVTIKRIMKSFDLTDRGIYKILYRYKIVKNPRKNHRYLWKQLDLFEDI